MNPKEAIDYLILMYQANEKAKMAINTLRTRLAALENIIQEVLDDPEDEMRETLIAFVNRRGR